MLRVKILCPVKHVQRLAKPGSPGYNGADYFQKSEAIGCGGCSFLILTAHWDRTIPDSAGRAIRLARAAGHLVYVNSGRPWCGVDPRVKAMGFHGFVCGCGLYIREGDEILFRQRLAKDVQQWAVDLVRRYRLQVMYEGADHVYFDLTRPLAPQVAAEKAYYDRMGLDTEGDPAGPEADFDKFVVWTGPGFDLDAFRREVEPGFDLILREGCLIELVSRGCSKGKAMEALMARHGMDRADCVAIGDSTTTCPCWRRRE